MEKVRKDYLGELEKVKNLIKSKWIDFDVRNSHTLLVKLGVYHYIRVTFINQITFYNINIIFLEK